jgi:hypothetical protein
LVAAYMISHYGSQVHALDYAGSSDDVSGMIRRSTSSSRGVRATLSGLGRKRSVAVSPHHHNKEENKLLELGTHHSVVFKIYVFPPPYQARRPRVWVFRNVIKRVSATELFIASGDCEHPEAPVDADTKVVRAGLVQASRLTEVSPGVTKLAVTVREDFKGRARTCCAGAPAEEDSHISPQF